MSDLDPTPPGLARLRHGAAGRSPLRYARRLAEVGTEILAAGLLDRLRPLQAEMRRIAPGCEAAGGGGLCIYLHWSPSGRVSGMVFDQLAGWRAAGFDIVLVSNAAPPPEDWARLADHAVLRIARDNVGRDFGGWRHGLAAALPRFGMPRELLLANDSVLGPVRPMAPVLAALRAGGDGLFGLTESRGGGPHLQSYLLLARGAGAVAEVAGHLAAYAPGRSKWSIVQRGEIGLTRRLLDRGHRVAALFGWARVGGAVDRHVLASLGPRFLEPGALERYPLNPTHHLWRLLVEGFGFPYLKTELVLRNPGRLPGVEAWENLVAPAMRPGLRDHLSVMRAG